MVCAGCGYVMTPFEKECPRCAGAPEARLMQPAAPMQSPASHAVEGAATPDFRDLSCPECGNRSVIKASAIVRAGQWTSRRRSVSYGAAFGPAGIMPVALEGSAVEVHRTELARALAPPQRRFYRSGLSARVIWIAVIGWTIGMVIGLALPSSWPWAQIVIVAAAAALIARLVNRDRQAKALFEAEDARDFARQMRAWEALFYCPRCDSILSSLTGKAFPAATPRGPLLDRPIRANRGIARR